nr:ribosomal protein S4 [Carex gibba]
MPALRFKTCRLLSGNVWKRKLSKIQRRILQRLRRRGKSIKRNLSMRENRNSNIKLQTTRKLSLFYGGLPIREMHRGRERTSYIPFLLNQETRLDVILVRLHFSKTLPQARQLISHRKVCVNNGLVSITHWKVSHGDLISFPENEVRTRSKKIRRSFYIDIFKKIIDNTLANTFQLVRRRRRIKKAWFRLLKRKRKRKRERERRPLLLNNLNSKLEGLRYFMKKKDLERRKKFGYAKVCLGSSFAEHNRMKRNLFHFKYYFLLKENNQNLPTRRIRRSTFFYKSSLYKCYGSPLTRKIRRKSWKIRIKRIELPTHYSEVNHRTLKAVVSYGPNIGHIPHDIRLNSVTNSPTLLLETWLALLLNNMHKLLLLMSYPGYI